MSSAEPKEPNLSGGRYNSTPFPSYSFMPGQNPHPRNDPKGHSHGKPEPTATYTPHEQWKKNEPWIFGVDLYNFGYWWESHEQWEALWKLDRNSEQENLFYRAVIQLAAANIKRFCERIEGAQSLARQAVEKLKALEGEHFMGVTIAPLIQEIEQYHVLERSSYIPRLDLREREG